MSLGIENLKRQKGYKVFNHTLAMVLHDYIQFGCEDSIQAKQFAKQVSHELVDLDILIP